MRITLQLIQNSFLQEIPSVILTIDAYKYIFNLPPSFQRGKNEHGQKIPKYGNYFFTKASASTIGGLGGYLLTLYQNILTTRTRLFLNNRMYKYMEQMRIFKGTKLMPISYLTWSGQTRIGTPNPNLITQIISQQNFHEIFNNLNEYLEKNAQAKDINNAYECYNQEKKCYQDQFLRIYPFEVQYQGQQITNFAIDLNQLEGNVIMTEVKKLGIPPNLIGKICAAGTFELPDGRIIKKQQITTPNHPGPNIIIIHLTNQKSIQALTKNQKFQQYLSTPNIFIQCVVYILEESKIVSSQMFKKLVHIFPQKTQHIISGRTYKDEKLQLDNWVKLPIRIASDINAKLPMCMPNLLKIYKEFMQKYMDSCTPIKQVLPHSKVHVAKNKYEFIVTPLKSQNYQPLVNIQNQPTKITPIIFKKSFGEDMEVELPWNHKQLDPKIVFLGTGSMYPTTFRNVSSILIEMDENNSFLFDCGEGSMSQIQTHYPIPQLNKRLLDIQIIFITHIHSDHNLGVLDLIIKRNKLMKQYNDKRKLFLIIPSNVYPWLFAYCKYIEDLTSGCQIVFIQTLKNQKLIFCTATQSKDEKYKKAISKCSKNVGEDGEAQPKIVMPPISKNLLSQILQKSGNQQQVLSLFTKYLQSIGVNKFLPVDVNHCPQSHGIVLQHKSKFKISYSGDCRPTPGFIQAAEGSTLMIHEATFGDCLLQNAIQNDHSTVGQALQAGIKSNSWKTALTHFSQRYISSKTIIDPLNYKMRQQIQKYLIHHGIVCYDHLQIKMSQSYKSPQTSQLICKMINCPQ